MNLNHMYHGAQRALVRNSPSILTAIGVSGTIGTALLTGRAAYLTAEIMERELPDGRKIKELSHKEILMNVFPLYIPPVLTGAVTIGAILGANHISSKRTAAAYSMLAVTQRAYEEYQTKVVEKIGEKKEQAIKDEVAQDRVSANPPRGDIILIGGAVLCLEHHAARYLACSVERLKKAENEINAMLLREGYASLNDFYYLIDAGPTYGSAQFGWDQETGLMEIKISYGSANDGRPCLVFDYSYLKPL